MFNAASKILKLTALAAIAVTAARCGSSDKKAAESLLAEADTCLSDGKYVESISLIDSIDSAYPAEVEIRRKGMLVRSKAMVANLEIQIAATDSLLMVYTNDIKEIMPKFAHVDGSDGNGYYYMKGAYTDNISGTTCVQARVNDVDYSYYIVANNTGSKLGINRIIIQGADGEASTPVLTDQRAGDTDEFGTDLATFSSSECDALGQWAYEHPGITSVTIIGTKGEKLLSLSGPSALQLGESWHFALVAGKMLTAKRLQEKLQRQIIIARDHVANLESEELEESEK